MSNFLRSTFLPTLAVASAGSFALGWFCRPVPALAPSAAAKPLAAVASSVASMKPAAVAPLHGDATGVFDAALAQPETEYRRRIRFARVAATLDRAGVLDALEREKTREPGDERTRTIEALIARYAEIDPAAAVNWLAQNYPTGHMDDSWMRAAVGEWVNQDWNGAVQWAKGLPRGGVRRNFGRAIIERLTEVDPQKALQNLASLAREEDWTTAIFAKFAARDVGFAIEQLKQLSNSKNENAIEGVVQGWAKQNPAEAYAWVCQIPTGGLHEGALDQLYRTWSDMDPTTAGAWLMAHPDLNRDRYARYVVSAWAERDFTVARLWAEQLPAKERKEAVGALIYQWSDRDLHGAMNYAVALPEAVNSLRSEIESTFRSWAKTDLPAARAWAEQQTSPSVREMLLPILLNTWSDVDPVACLGYLKTLRAQTAADDIGGASYSVPIIEVNQTNAIYRWAQQSPQEVLQWSQSETDPKTRESAINAALQTLMRSDPVKGKPLLDRYMATLSGGSIAGVASSWAINDPVAAASWAAALPAEKLREPALSSVTQSWAQSDFTAATAWIEQQPAGSARDTAISSLYFSAFGSGSSDTRLKAAQLAQSMHPSNLRDTTMIEIASSWLTSEPAAAKRWIEQSGFTAEQRAEIFHSENQAAASTTGDKQSAPR